MIISLILAASAGLGFANEYRAERAAEALHDSVQHAGLELFRSGWFAESLATQTLVAFAVRTRRVPFLHSRPSWQLASTALVVVAIGVALRFAPCPASSPRPRRSTWCWPAW